MLTEPKQLIFNIPNVTTPTTHHVVCYQWGNDNAERTLVCVHGLTRNGRDFDFLAKAMADGYRVICPDIPGRGLSEWRNAEDYLYPNYVTDMGFILASLHLTQVDWVGTSMGGIIGMMLANSVPGLFRSLTLNDVGCTVSAAGMKRILAYPPSRNPCPTRAEAEAILRERCDTFGIRDEAHWQHMFKYGLQEKNGCFRANYDPAIMAAYAKDRDKDAVITDISLWPLWEVLTKIPVLLIRGETSDILTRETAQLMQSSHPRLTLKEIPACGHAPALMEDGQIAIVKAWLANLPH
jgi:pimeloyl-ACP methyl ester carboxylesterase